MCCVWKFGCCEYVIIFHKRWLTMVKEKDKCKLGSNTRYMCVYRSRRATILIYTEVTPACRGCLAPGLWDPLLPGKSEQHGVSGAPWCRVGLCAVYCALGLFGVCGVRPIKWPLCLLHAAFASVSLR